MARQLARICPRCNGYLGVIVGKRTAQSMTQSINGSCVVCSHKLRWTLFNSSRVKAADYSGHIPKIFDLRGRHSPAASRDN